MHFSIMEFWFYMLIVHQDAPTGNATKTRLRSYLKAHIGWNVPLQAVFIWFVLQ